LLILQRLSGTKTVKSDSPNRFLWCPDRCGLETRPLPNL
jgi:hypothetical protein